MDTKILRAAQYFSYPKAQGQTNPEPNHKIIVGEIIFLVLFSTILHLFPFFWGLSYYPTSCAPTSFPTEKRLTLLVDFCNKTLEVRVSRQFSVIL